MVIKLMNEDPTAVTGRRVLAALVDLVVFVSVLFVVFIVVAEKQPNWGLDIHNCGPAAGVCTNIGDTTYIASGGRSALLLLFAASYLAFVFVLRRGRSGRTLGMNAVGIRVVDEHGAPPGLARAALRSAAGVADYLPLCVPVVGLVTIATSPFHQRIGDMAARTFVVGERFASHALPARESASVRSRSRPRPRRLKTVCWAATAAGALVAAMLLAVLWTVTYRVNSGEFCGTVLSPAGNCDLLSRGQFLAITIGVASMPVLALAGPFWVAELVSRRRALQTTTVKAGIEE